MHLLVTIYAGYIFLVISYFLLQFSIRAEDNGTPQRFDIASVIVRINRNTQRPIFSISQRNQTITLLENTRLSNVGRVQATDGDTQVGTQIITRFVEFIVVD